MKYYKTKKNALIKFSFTTILVGSLLLGGCENSTTNNNQEDNEIDNSINNKNKIEFRQMSDEETNNLIEGQEIEVIDETILTVPNSELLEERGLDYEIVLEIWAWGEDKQKTLQNIKSYIYHDQEIDLNERSFIYEGEQRFAQDFLIGIKIVPITAAYIDEATGIYYKTVLLDNLQYKAGMENPDNLTILENIIIQRANSEQ